MMRSFRIGRPRTYPVGGLLGLLGAATVSQSGPLEFQSLVWDR